MTLTTSGAGSHRPPPRMAYTAPIPTPRTAPAAESPCQLHAYHAPIVVRTQHHHQHPQYLQVRLWGTVTDPASLWVCGTCHDSIHAWLDWLLGDARKPDPEPGRLAKAEAERTYDWYMAVKGGGTG